MEEQWRDIVGFEDSYQVSNLGNIRSKDRIIKHCNGKQYHWKSRPIKQHFDCDGYYIVGLHRNGKDIGLRSHRVVAEAWLSDWDPNLVVNHINGIKTDNRVENLEMMTIKENNNHFWTAPCFEEARQIYIENHRKASSGENNPMWGVKRHLSNETKRKMSESHKGKHLSSEQIEKLRLAHVGKKRSEETCKRISEAKKRNMTEEVRRRISEGTKDALARKKGLTND